MIQGLNSIYSIPRQTDLSHRAVKKNLLNSQNKDIVSFTSSPSLTTNEKAVLNELLANKPDSPENIVLITDPNKDPDDLASYVMTSKLQKEGFVDLKAVVTTLGDEDVRTDRAKFAKGAFAMLGMENVPIGVGVDYEYHDEKRAKDDQKFLDDSEVSSKEFTEKGSNIRRNGQELLRETLEKAEDKSLTITIIAGMTDVAEIIRNNESLFNQKVKKIAIMGGVKDTLNKQGFIEPDERAYNNTTDYESAKVVYQKAQELDIPLVVLPKESAYAAAVPRKFYEGLSKTEHPVGKYLHGIQKSALNGLWGVVQQGIIKPLTPEWFFKTFTSLDTEKDKGLIDRMAKEEGNFDQIWDRVTQLNLYDPLTVLSTVLPATNFCMNPRQVNDRHPVEVIEISDAEKTKDLMSALSKTALSENERKG